MSLQPRTATPADVAQLVHVINRAYIAEAPFVRGPRTDYASISARLSASNTWFLIADADEDTSDDERRIAGCVCLDCDEERGHIGLLSVDPDYQKRGLGAQLLRAAESLCLVKLRDADIELEVVSLRGDLFPFYAHMGYERIGVAPFPNESLLKQPAHMVVMRKTGKTD